MDEGAFDIIILGTGLTESIAAAALAKAGFKVAHIDKNSYYGDADASLSIDEFVAWGKQNAIGFTCSSDTIPSARQYSISLAPSVIPSVGPLISSLVSSGVARYGGFRLVETVGVYNSDGSIKTVPGSKEDVFKNKDISLIDKRRLMRFLMFAAGEFEGSKELESKEDTSFVQFLQSVFSLKDDAVTAIAYALSYCFSPSDTTMDSLVRIRRYLRSTGRYGASPFLVGHYGSSGEIAQGFCRTAAVAGSVYILGRKLTSFSADADSKYTVHLEDFPDPLTANLIISSRSYIPSNMESRAHYVKPTLPRSHTHSLVTARCVAIIDRPLKFTSTPNVNVNDESSPPPSMDTGILVFPPFSLSQSTHSVAVTALIVGEGTMSTPKGKWIIYISTLCSTTESAETLLQPYLETTLKLTSGEQIAPLFTSFYTDSPAPSIPQLRTNAKTSYLVPPRVSCTSLPDGPDEAAIFAEAVFWEVIEVMKPKLTEQVSTFWPPNDEQEEDADDF